MTDKKYSKVTEEEFNSFIGAYERPLDKDVNMIFEPPMLAYHDFTLSDKSYDAIVAYAVLYDGSDYHFGQTKEHYVDGVAHIRHKIIMARAEEAGSYEDI